MIFYFWLDDYTSIHNGKKGYPSLKFITPQNIMRSMKKIEDVYNKVDLYLFKQPTLLQFKRVRVRVKMILGL